MATTLTSAILFTFEEKQSIKVNASMLEKP